jgi:hypothetical protein
VEATLPRPTEPAKRKFPAFGTASLVFAILTVVLPVIVLISFGLKAEEAMQPTPDDPNRAKDIGEAGRGVVPFAIMLAGFALAVAASGLSGLVGTITGILALIRLERAVWRPIIGLIVNVPPALFFLYLVVMIAINGGG